MRLLAFFGAISIGAIPAFGQSPNEPKELGSLRESYDKARSAALAPIDKKYADALAVMKERLTKAGNLEGALAVDAELKKLQPAQSVREDGKLRLSKLKTVDEFTRWLMTTKWRSVRGSLYQFPQPGAIQITSSTGQIVDYPLTVLKVGGISWTYLSSNATEVLEIASDLQSATGKILGTLTRVEDH